MKNRRWKLSLTAVLLVPLSGCAIVAAEPSPTQDGKCHGDYNSPTCIYLF